MLPADQIHVADEAFRQRRVIQRGQEHQQRAPAQPQPDERAEFIEIRRHDLRLQGVKRVAAGAVMGLAVFGAHEFFHLVGERQQAEQIPLLLRGQPEHQRGGDETLQTEVRFEVSRLRLSGGPRLGRTWLRGAQPRGVHDHIDLLGPFDLENLRDRPAPPGGGLPVDFIVAVAGNVFAQFFEIAALADLPLRVEAEGAPVQNSAARFFRSASRLG